MCSVRWYNASAHYALTLALSLRKSGLNVILFGLPGSPFLSKAKEYRFNLIENIGLMNQGIVQYIINLYKFRKLIIKKKIDLLNPYISRDHFFAYLSLFGKNKNIVRTRTDSKIPKSNIFNKIFYRISSGNYIVSSKYMISHITAMGLPENRITVIPLELNYKDYSTYKSKKNLKYELGINKVKKVVSFVGRLDRIKGVEYFIKSFSYLKNKNKFHYIVSGEEINLFIDELKDLASSLKINSISFIGKADDARDILKITDIGVVPSIGSEAICRIGLEMLAFGIPIVGSNINSIPELINEYGGRVVSPGSPLEIANALEYLAVPENYRNIQNQIKQAFQKKQPDQFVLSHVDIFLKELNK
ncbi:MAG: glycosyltransferase family 4 protein [Spirochaetota bacterium]